MSLWHSSDVLTVILNFLASVIFILLEQFLGVCGGELVSYLSLQSRVQLVKVSLEREM